MTYPPQPGPSGQPGSWSDPSWPTPQPYADPAAQPYSAQPYSGQPYSGQPYSGQPYSGQPSTGQPYADQYTATPYAAAPYAQPYGYPAARTTNSLAIVALVLSLMGILACGVTSLIGAILGHVARSQIRQRGEDGDGLALAAIISGWILVALYAVGAVAYFVFVVWIFNQAANDTTAYTLLPLFI